MNNELYVDDRNILDKVNLIINKSFIIYHLYPLKKKKLWLYYYISKDHFNNIIIYHVISMIEDAITECLLVRMFNNPKIQSNNLLLNKLINKLSGACFFVLSNEYLNINEIIIYIKEKFLHHLQ